MCVRHKEARRCLGVQYTALEVNANDTCGWSNLTHTSISSLHSFVPWLQFCRASGQITFGRLLDKPSNCVVSRVLFCNDITTLTATQSSRQRENHQGSRTCAILSTVISEYIASFVRRRRQLDEHKLRARRDPSASTQPGRLPLRTLQLHGEGDARLMLYFGPNALHSLKFLLRAVFPATMCAAAA